MYKVWMGLKRECSSQALADSEESIQCKLYETKFEWANFLEKNLFCRSLKDEKKNFFSGWGIRRRMKIILLWDKMTKWQTPGVTENRKKIVDCPKLFKWYDSGIITSISSMIRGLNCPSKQVASLY